MAENPKARDDRVAQAFSDVPQGSLPHYKFRIFPTGTGVIPGWAFQPATPVINYFKGPNGPR